MWREMMYYAKQWRRTGMTRDERQLESVLLRWVGLDDERLQRAFMLIERMYGYDE